MSREIQANDLVHITQPGFTTATYIIRRIDQNGIYVSSEANPNTFSLLVSDQRNGWKVHGFGIKYMIQFQAWNPSVANQHFSHIKQFLLLDQFLL